MASFCYLDVKTAHCRDMVYKANRRWGLLVWPYKVVHVILFALVSVDYNLIMCKTCLLCRRKKQIVVHLIFLYSASGISVIFKI